MGTSTEQLRYDIEQTRGNLGDTLDAIGDRVSPGRMMERRRQRMRDRMTMMRCRMMGTADQASSYLGGATETVRHAPEMVREQTEGSPLAVGAVVATAGFLVGSLMKPTNAETQASTALMERAAPLREELKTTGQELADTLKTDAGEAVEELRHSATESAEKVRETARPSSR